MKVLKIVYNAIKKPKSALIVLIRSPRIAKHIPSKIYLKMLFYLILGRTLDLNNPKTLNEKLQWMKLYDHRLEYVMMVDKYKVRDYVKKSIGEEYLVPLINVWDDPDNINFNDLPEKFVLKCNHNSGEGMCICRDKSKLNIQNVRSELKKGLQSDYYSFSREWPYSKVPRKVICEALLEYKDINKPIEDYKFMCFNGVVDSVFICEGRFSKRGVRFHYFDREWNYLPYCPYPDIDPSTFTMPKPKNYAEMVRIAETLSKGYPALRIDLYNIDGKIYFGEITLFTQSGFDTTITYDADKKMGEKYVLPN